MKPISSKNLIVPSLSLFTSLGTLLCCALPSLFVAIGAGAVLAGLISNMPFLIVLSKYKIILFMKKNFTQYIFIKLIHSFLDI